MDAHARSIMCKGTCRETGGLYAKLFADCTSSAEAREWLVTFPQPVYSAYESGCTGFWLARELRELGDGRDAIAVSTLPGSAKDRQAKRDRLGARVVLREIMNPLSDYSAVWLPDVEGEAARDLARARQGAVRTVKAAKQEVSSLLLRYRFAWNEKTPAGKLKKAWRGDYRKWLDGIEPPGPSAQAALGHCKRAVRRAGEEPAKMDGLVRGQAEEPR